MSKENVDARQWFGVDSACEPQDQQHQELDKVLPALVDRWEVEAEIREHILQGKHHCTHLEDRVTLVHTVWLLVLFNVFQLQISTCQLQRNEKLQKCKRNVVGGWEGRETPFIVSVMPILHTWA